MKNRYACPDCAKCQQVRDLRDSVKLIIGRHNNMPWTDVPEREVDAYVETVRELRQYLAKTLRDRKVTP